MYYVPLVKVLELVEPSEVVGDKDGPVYALLFRGDWIDMLVSVASDEDWAIEPDDLDSLINSPAGLIMFVDSRDAMNVSFHSEEDELEDEWESFKEDADAVETDDDEDFDE